MTCCRWSGALALLTGLVLLAAYALYPAQASTGPELTSIAEGALPQAPALIASYCGGCHSNGRSRIEFTAPPDRYALRHERAAWESVARVLQSGMMPPRTHPQPSAVERRHLVTWLEAELANLDAEQPRRFLVRRLSLAEYRNIVRDLLGVDWRPQWDFPDDERGWEFADTAPELPAPLRDAYRAAADEIVRCLGLTDQSGLFAAAVPDCDATEPELGAEDRAVLGTLVERAFRGPAADELAALFAEVERDIAEGLSRKEALGAALKQVLSSPRLLYQVERWRSPEQPAGARCDEVELASRLSFFLWGSAPDKELLTLASQGQLRHNLEAQSRRMIQDPRTHRLASSLANTWLGLSGLDEADHVEPELRRALRAETEAFLAWILQQDRPALELLDADYTFVNERLARHYGLDGARGDALRRVSTAATSRGGLLGHASILTVTSPAGQPSAVQRGKWVLTNLLGTPPPAPPSGALDGFKTTRKSFPQGTPAQLLALHRTHRSCVNCHQQIEGIGQALDEFDSSGASILDYKATSLDAIALPSGETLQSAADLKAYVLRHSDLFLRVLRARLASCAFHRPLRADDLPTAGEMDPQASGPVRLSALVLAVVQSEAFQNGPTAP